MSKPPAKRVFRQSSLLNSFRPVPNSRPASGQRMDATAKASDGPATVESRSSEYQRSLTRDSSTPTNADAVVSDASPLPASTEHTECASLSTTDVDSDASCSQLPAHKAATLRPCSNASALRRCPPHETDIGDLSQAERTTATFNVNDVKAADKRPPRPWPSDYRDFWDNNHVRLPCSPRSEVVVGRGDARVQSSRWKAIEEALSRPMQSSWDIEEAILSYNSHYAQRWNFDGLHQFFDPAGDKGGADRAERALYLQQTVPAIARLALSVPHVLPGGVPLLRRSRPHTLLLSQLQVACLLANAFFCTFPHRNSTRADSEYSAFPSINFSSLFQGDRGRRTLSSRRAAKLRCILHYFQCVTSNPPTGVVSYERRVLDDAVAKSGHWAARSDAVADVFVSDDGMIEDDGDGMLQADFANKFIGGGVLNRGCVQEEIRFMLCPELIASRLFTEMMLDREAVVIVGAERFSSYSGYADTFRWTGPYADVAPLDAWRRRCTTVLAFDALVFHSKPAQFRKTPLAREVSKAYCAFSGTPSAAPDQRVAVASGNWGCGAFGGDHYLKALLQLIASSAAGRQLVYFTFGNGRLSADLLLLHGALRANSITLGELWQAVLAYGDTFGGATSGGRHFYSFLHQSLCGGGGGESDGTEPFYSEATEPLSPLLSATTSLTSQSCSSPPVVAEGGGGVEAGSAAQADGGAGDAPQADDEADDEVVLAPVAAAAPS